MTPEPDETRSVAETVEAAESPSTAPVPVTASSPPAEDTSIAATSVERPTAARRRDRWAHRRGEPRLFVFLWTSYLFAATLLTLVAVSASNALTVDAYRPAARLLIASVAVGVSLLWPMVRLSQALPARGGFLPALQDYVIVTLPAQAVIWPQWVLAGLPPTVIGAAAASVAAWGLVVGGLLAHALTARARSYAGVPTSDEGPSLSPAARAGWMVVFIIVALAGGAGAMAVSAAGSAPTPFRLTWMLSPITAVFEVSADRSWMGVPARAAPEHWAVIGLTAAASAPIWVLAAARSRGLRRSNRLH